MTLLLRRLALAALSGFAGLAWTQTFRAKGFTFDPSSGISNRLITPNGDGKNDVVIFTVSNPRDSALTGTIYDLQGKQVSSMDVLSSTQMRWDGKSGGTAVPSGIYLYLIEAEETAYTGTLVVIR